MPSACHQREVVPASPLLERPTHPHCSHGFEDERRVNVALTRAKNGLVLVGDEGALRSEAFYERMVEWAR